MFSVPLITKTNSLRGQVALPALVYSGVNWLWTEAHSHVNEFFCKIKSYIHTKSNQLLLAPVKVGASKSQNCITKRKNEEGTEEVAE